MIDFIGRRRFYAAFSLLMLIPALIGLAVWQFEPGLDFAGGLESEVRFLRDVEVAELEEAIAGVPLPDGAATSVSAGDDGEFIVELSLGSADAEAVQQTGGELLNAITGALGVTDLDDASFAADSARYEIWFAEPTTQDEVRAALETVDLGAARIQATGSDSFRIRVEQPEDGDLEGLRTRINDSLRAEIGPIVVLQSSSVSGVLSAEIAQDAGIALAVAAAAILIYISLAFRRLPNPVLYGSAAIVALLHDITLVAGAFAIGGQVAGLEVNAMFVTALLAIIGYSVNDTIVVFDRIRENLLLDPREDFRHIVNAAITQSLGRSLNTSITVVLALMALFLIGGVTVRPFVIVLLIGTAAGTYSSIAVASQLLVLWQDGTLPRLLRLGGERRAVRTRRA